MPGSATPKRVSAVLIGKYGVGKTSLFNKLADETVDSDSCSCQGLRAGVYHNEVCDIKLIDVPGGEPCASHNGLTCGPLNGIFVLIEYHPRIGSTLVDAFWDTFQVLKYEHLDMVTVVVTKMDRFSPGNKWPTADHVKSDICRVFDEDVGVHRVLFSHPGSKKDDLARSIFSILDNLPPVQLQYVGAEITEYFGINLVERCKRKRIDEDTEANNGSFQVKVPSEQNYETVELHHEYTPMDVDGADLMRNGWSWTRGKRSHGHKRKWRKVFKILRRLCCVHIVLVLGVHCILCNLMWVVLVTTRCDRHEM